MVRDSIIHIDVPFPFRLKPRLLAQDSDIAVSELQDCSRWDSFDEASSVYDALGSVFRQDLEGSFGICRPRFSRRGLQTVIKSASGTFPRAFGVRYGLLRTPGGPFGSGVLKLFRPWTL